MQKKYKSLGLMSGTSGDGVDASIINSDGSKFTEDNWINSETYCYSKQLKSIISDKHTRKYLALSEKDQISTQFKVWGK